MRGQQFQEELGQPQFFPLIIYMKVHREGGPRHQLRSQRVIINGEDTSTKLGSTNFIRESMFSQFMGVVVMGEETSRLQLLSRILWMDVK